MLTLIVIKSSLITFCGMPTWTCDYIICCTLAIERVVVVELLFNHLLLVKPNADALVTFATHVINVHT